ncbi:hypothetical protein [Gemmatimonas sp.]|jgi:hypothetical protein|uniref:hypothetical protein n=1 Tax=Gemmatimonas sp. TaxID=1962908 RepID=UPI0037BF8466
MSLRRRYLLSTAVAVIAIGCSRDLEPLQQVSLQPKLGALSESLVDSLGLIGDVAVEGGHLVVTDVKAHRLLQLDSIGSGRLQGRRGQGPGEFAFPLFVDARGSRVVVGDQGNGRFQQFNWAGALKRVFNSPVPVRHFAIESDSTLLVALADSAWYLARVFEDGRWEPFAKRPSSAAARLARGDHLVAMAADRQVAVFDQDRAVLLIYDVNGNATIRSVLPEDITAALGASSSEQQRALSQRFGQLLSAPVIKDLAGDGAGHLLLLFSAGTTVGLWMDVPRDLRVLLTTDDADRDDPFWSAVAADVYGDSLVVTSSAGQVYKRRVRP